MLIRAKTLEGYQLQSIDGAIGKVKDFYFDDKHWGIRYLVADTGKWLPGRQVLISPHALGHVLKDEKRVSIELTKNQIENSPSLESDKPVSKQFEQEYYAYYGWPMYWDGPYMWGSYPNIMRPIMASPVMVNVGDTEMEPHEKHKEWDPNLRSRNTVSGYHIQATDGEIGHVEDFVIDDETWAIRYLVVDTKNWWPGKKVLVSPQWIAQVSWEDSKVFVNLSRDTIKQSPEFTEASLLSREYETGLHQHYGRREYWLDEEVAKTHTH